MKMKIKFPGGKKVNAEVGKFTIETDQSIASGGKASAPEPYDLFFASIGTCTGIYLKSFCDRRKINTSGLEIIQSMDYDQKTKLVTKISMEIKLPDDFPTKYKHAIINTAKLCTVKRNLEKPPKFDIFTSK